MTTGIGCHSAHMIRNLSWLLPIITRDMNTQKVAAKKLQKISGTEMKPKMKKSENSIF